MLTEDEIRTYQDIHQAIYKTPISAEDACEQGTKLVVFLETIFKSPL